jgi:hypothetical protein
VSSDFLTNPVFIPASKPIADTFVSAIFVPMPAEVVNLVATFARLGPVVALPTTAAAANASVVQYAEIVDVDLLFYCNHTQVYLQNFLPVPVDIVGNMSLIVASNGTFIDAPICFGSRTILHTLPANYFATVGRVSLAFCPQATIRAAALRLHFSVLNETGVPINFQVDSPPFDLVIGSFPSFSSGSSDAALLAEYIAGNKSLSAYSYYVSSSIPCDHMTFDYVARLSCVLANGSLSAATPFYTTGQSQRVTAVSAKGTVVRACIFNVTGWTFMLAGRCSIYAYIPTFSNIPLYSASFQVVSGNPMAAKVIGAIAMQLEEAAVVWSTNATGAKCLSLSLFDKFNNTVTNCQTSFELFAIVLNGTERSSYSLYGSTKGVSDCNGTVSWCSARTTRIGAIMVGVASPFFNTTLPVIINISGQGQAAQIAVLTPIIANGSAIQGGTVLPPVTITLMNAVGAASVSKSNVVIRIRVIPMLQNR